MRHGMAGRALGFVALLGTLALVGCSSIAIGPRVTGSGVLKSETRQVSNFRVINFSGVGTLKIDQTGTESLTIEADDNLLPYLTSEVEDGTLTLGIKNSENISTQKGITYTLTVKTLDHLTVSGAGTVDIKRFSGPSLTVKLSGVGNVTVTGQADVQEVVVSGVGNYDGSAFATKTATVNVSGTGSAVVQVSETLDATVSGVGSIEYLGDPKVTSHVTGLGHVKNR